MLEEKTIVYIRALMNRQVMGIVMYAIGNLCNIYSGKLYVMSLRCSHKTHGHVRMTVRSNGRREGRL